MYDMTGMKHIILAFAMLVLSSCARTYVREWGDGKITACGNKAANRETIDQLAKEKCGGDATAIGGHLVNSGVAYAGYGVFRNTDDNCVVYRCNGGGPAPASVEPAEEKHKALLDGVGL